MGFCKSLSKALLIIFNILFLAIALGAIALSIWLLVDPSFSISLTQEPGDYMISVVIMLVTSILLGIVSIFGVCGAANERSGCLYIFCSLLLIILGAEISAGVWGYVNRDDLMVQVGNAIKHTVEHEYHHNDNKKILFDTFQKNLKCCGASKPSDWIGNEQVVMRVAPGPYEYSIPKSCCVEGVSDEVCAKATQNIIIGGLIDESVVYSQGCSPLIISELKSNAGLWMGVGIAIIVLQVLGLIFALFLIHHVNSSKKR